MAKPSKKIGVLFSGGLDSCALISYYLDQGWHVTPVFVQSNLPWEKAESFWAQKFLKKIASPHLKPKIDVQLILDSAYNKNWSKTGKTPGLKSQDRAVYLPARNLLLITKAALALVPQSIFNIAIATLDGNPFEDGRRQYFNLLEKILKRGFQKPIRIFAPFRKWKKANIIRKNRAAPLEYSFSCISPIKNYHCGRCNKCAERRRAFKKSQQSDKTVYKFIQSS